MAVNRNKKIMHSVAYEMKILTNSSQGLSARYARKRVKFICLLIKNYVYFAARQKSISVAIVNYYFNSFYDAVRNMVVKQTPV